MSDAVRVSVVGAAGRMGTRVINRLSAHSGLTLGSVLVAPGDSVDLPDSVVVATSPEAAFAAADVVVDFSAPAACAATMPAAAKAGLAYVLASTGLTDADEAAVAAAATKCAVLQAANMSVGVNVLLNLVERAAGLLSGFEIEISEIHHKHKRDAPSGTARALGAAAQAARPELNEVSGRDGLGPVRDGNELGYAAIRGGEVAGEHTVFFFGDSERVELTHRATSADIFADGALRAALWLARRPAGRYSMRDVLGL